MNQIIKELELQGFRASYISFSRMADIARDYEALVADNPQIEYVKGAARHFNNYKEPKIEFTPESILVVAAPSEIARVYVNRHGERISVSIPPTYIGDELYDAMKQAARTATESRGFHTAPVNGVSHKLLAVRSGLGKYGRNNICYVNGLGSFVQLRAYYTDVPCDDNFHPMARLDACAKCTLCRKNCPTGIITDAGAIDASRCLTMLNEQKGEFPAWLDPAAHNCLIGCMKCQESCPDNREHMYFVDTVEFDEDETGFILSKFDDEPYPEPIAEKFKAISNDFYIAVIARNLRALLRV